MWSCSKTDLESSKTQVFMELCKDVHEVAPGARLNYALRIKLDKLSSEDRKDIVNKKWNDSTPLFVACKRGLAEIVNYLASHCMADLELKCFYYVDNDPRLVHYVTPLWCAAVADKLDVVKVLLRHGAQINSVSDSGSTAVRSACFMTNIDIVKYLVDQGADISISNFTGGTCLINSVQSATLCEYLLDHGADINALDIKNNTALHYAIEEHRFKTVKLLIERGANPFIKNKVNYDAIQTACIKLAPSIFSYLLTVLNVNPEQEADGHELLGATYLDEHDDKISALKHWKAAVKLRDKHNITKEVLPPVKAFTYTTEFTTLDQVEDLILDSDAMKIQSLLICQRILGPTHTDTTFRIMFRGATYADTLQYRKCINLWIYALSLRIKEDTILYGVTFLNSRALTRLCLDVLEKYPLEEARSMITFKDSFRALRLLGDELGKCQQLLSVRPQFQKHVTNFDLTISIIIYYIYIILRVITDEKERDQLRSYLHHLLVLHPVTQAKGQTLLHLAVTKNNSATLEVRDSHHPFPNVETAELLIEAGAHINATDIDGASPLFLASNENHYLKKVSHPI